MRHDLYLHWEMHFPFIFYEYRAYTYVGFNLSIYNSIFTDMTIIIISWA
jgi:hypothetical protein